MCWSRHYTFFLILDAYASRITIVQVIDPHKCKICQCFAQYCLEIALKINGDVSLMMLWKVETWGNI